MKEDTSNVINLECYRQRTCPTDEEVEAHLLSVAEKSESPSETEVAAALLILFRDGEIRAKRTPEGQFLYALRKEGSTKSRGSGSVQSISAAPRYNRVADDLRGDPNPNHDCE